MKTCRGYSLEAPYQGLTFVLKIKIMLSSVVHGKTRENIYYYHDSSLFGKYVSSGILLKYGCIQCSEVKDLEGSF